MRGIVLGGTKNGLALRSGRGGLKGNISCKKIDLWILYSAPWDLEREHVGVE